MSLQTTAAIPGHHLSPKDPPVLDHRHDFADRGESR
jgi:hypothetical protein